MSEVFDELFSVNVNDHTEKKMTGNAALTYLSWPFAWAEVKKRYPDSHYEIEKFNGLPYVYDEKTGYMVYTTVTINDVTHEMWLPVMDGSNKAMKSEPYEYTTKFYGKETTKTVSAATMFDINKTIMRCLVKNLAMFGLGLYIFAGEDLPITDSEAVANIEDDAKVRSDLMKKITANITECSKQFGKSAGEVTDQLKKAGIKFDSLSTANVETLGVALALMEKWLSKAEKK